MTRLIDVVHAGAMWTVAVAAIGVPASIASLAIRRIVEALI
jgi:hypothetical protein